MISLIIHEFCQICEGFVRFTSNSVGRSSMIPGIHYLSEGRIDVISLIIHEFCQIWEGVVRLTSNFVGCSDLMPGIYYQPKKDILT